MIIDNYIFIDPVGKSGKEPILIYKKKNENNLMVAQAIFNDFFFCNFIDLVSYIGEKR